MHSEFDLRWKLDGDALTLTRTSDNDVVDAPQVFRRDPTVDCSGATAACADE